MLNSIGLPNKGLDGFLAEDLPRLAELPVPLIVSIMATTRDDFARCVARVGRRREVAAIELNVSCPNVHSGLIVGEDPSETEALLDDAAPADREAADREVDAERGRPGGGRGGRRAGRGGRGLADQHAEGRPRSIRPPGSPRSATDTAGYRARRCGRWRSSRCARSRAAVDLPIVGMGGISSGADAAEFIALGASVVAVGTESFRDPRGRFAGRDGTGVITPPERSTEPALDLD